MGNNFEGLQLSLMGCLVLNSLTSLLPVENPGYPFNFKIGKCESKCINEFNFNKGKELYT